MTYRESSIKQQLNKLIAKIKIHHSSKFAGGTLAKAFATLASIRPLIQATLNKEKQRVRMSSNELAPPDVVFT